MTEAFHTTEMLKRGVGDTHKGQKTLLALYLHDDNLQRATAAHLFPQRVLSNDLVMGLLDQHYLLWPWEFTVDENFDLLKEQNDRIVRDTG